MKRFFTGAGTDSLSLQAMPYKRQRRLQDMFAAPARPKAAAAPASVGAGAVAAGTAPEPLAAAVAGKRLGGASDARPVAKAATVAAVATVDPPAKRRKPGQQGIAAFFNPKQ